jgi:hypothetical protein
MLAIVIAVHSRRTVRLWDKDVLHMPFRILKGKL